MKEGIWIPIVLFIVTDANVLPISVALVGLAVFLVWLFQDEVATLG